MLRYAHNKPQGNLCFEFQCNAGLIHWIENTIICHRGGEPDCTPGPHHEIKNCAWPNL